MKWEYLTYLFGEYSSSYDTVLDKFGSKGWELVSVDNGIAYFKRPIPDEIPIYIVRDVSKSQEVNLNFLGREGWRLVSVDNGIAYLERPIPDANVYRDGVKLDLKGDD